MFVNGSRPLYPSLRLRGAAILVAAGLIVTHSRLALAQTDFGWVKLKADAYSTVQFAEKKTKWWSGKQVDAVLQIEYKRLQHTPDKPGYTYKTMRAFVEFDCPGRKFNLRAAVFYSATGEVVLTDNYSTLQKEWKEITGASDFQLVMTKACELTSSLDDRWHEAGNTADYLAFYDTASVVLRPNGVVQFWTRQQFKQPQTEKLKTETIHYTYSLVQFEIDCPRSQWRMLQIHKYSKDGRAVASEDYTTIAFFESVSPESSADRYRSFVCKL